MILPAIPGVTLGPDRSPARPGRASPPAPLASPGQAIPGLPVRRHERSLNVRDITASPLAGRSAAGMHVIDPAYLLLSEGKVREDFTAFMSDSMCRVNNKQS